MSMIITIRLWACREVIGGAVFPRDYCACSPVV